MRIAIAQINTIVGDVEHNLHAALRAYNHGRMMGSDLVVFPELTLSGYPPEDLLFREDFLDAIDGALDQFAKHTTRCAAIVGLPERYGVDLYNSAAVLHDGRLHGFYRKKKLPNYGVFDEKRYFREGSNAPDWHGIFHIAGIAVGVSICEDIWVVNSPVLTQAHTADVLVNLSASPYNAKKLQERQQILAYTSSYTKTPIVYANLIGGQDELVFDGGSMVYDEEGVLVAQSPFFFEDTTIVDLALGDPDVTTIGPAPRDLDYEEEVYSALVLGTRDYVRKNGFKQVLIGLSGGIDSALVAAIAVDALGPDNVYGIMMPSKFSSEGSITDAKAVARNLGIKTKIVPIVNAHMSLDVALERPYTELFPLSPKGNADENVQARIRGLLMMALSNTSGAMVLTTGNKSEMAVGYATLYGDMAGGFAVIKDVPKTLVFRLCEWLNERDTHPQYMPEDTPRTIEVIPRAIITKPPSAELRPDQKDTDSLPPYEVLDPILEMYVEQDASPEDIVKALAPKPSGPLDLALVKKVCRMVDRNEYKRRQAAPGVRITPKAFGRGRRLPIVNSWANKATTF